MVDTLKNKNLTAMFKLINTSERFINNISQFEHCFGNLIFCTNLRIKRPKYKYLLLNLLLLVEGASLGL